MAAAIRPRFQRTMFAYNAYAAPPGPDIDPPPRPRPRPRPRPDSQPSKKRSRYVVDDSLQFKFDIHHQRIARLQTRFLDGTVAVQTRNDIVVSTTHKSFIKNPAHFTFRFMLDQHVRNMLSEFGFNFTAHHLERNDPFVDYISSSALELLEKSVSRVLTLRIDIKVVDIYLQDEREALEVRLRESIAEYEQEGLYGFVPADHTVIDKLERVRFQGKDSTSTSCTICMDDFKMGSVVTRMPCAHCFHGRCITPWLKTNHVCPNCRFELPKSATTTS